MLLRRERAMTAVAIVLEVAFLPARSDTLGAAEIAEQLNGARRGIEPVLQALSRAGVLESVRGPRGGYRLARRPRDLRLIDVVRAVIEPAESRPVGEAAAGTLGRLGAAVVTPLWDEMDALCDGHLAGLSVEDLLKRAAAAGLRRAAPQPLDFSI